MYPRPHRSGAIAIALTMLLLPALCRAQDGPVYSPLEGSNEFWGVFQKNFRDWMLDDRNGNLRRADPLQLELAISAEHDATVQVEIPGIGFAQKVNIAAGTTAHVPIDTAAQLRSSLVPERLAFHITSDQPIVVTGTNRRFQTTDLFQVLPAGSLGTRYRAMGYRPLQKELVSQFAVIATEDNTVVRISPSCDIVEIASPRMLGLKAATETERNMLLRQSAPVMLDSAMKAPRKGTSAVRVQESGRSDRSGRNRRANPPIDVDANVTISAPTAPAVKTSSSAAVSAPKTSLLADTTSRLISDLHSNQPIEIKLQRGEVVQVIPWWRPAQPSDITGSLIESNHPVAVFSGHNCAYVPNPTVKACNTLVEQMPPTSSWGSRFVVAPPAERNSAVVRVLADHDNTVVQMNGATVAKLNHGEIYENTDVQRPSLLTTSKPTLVALFTKGFDAGDNVGDPSMTIVPPFHEHRLGYRLLPEPIRGNWKHTLMLAVPEEAIGSLRLGGVPVMNPQMSKIEGSNYAVVYLKVPREASTVTCDVPFAAMQFGLGYDDAAYDGYGFAYGYPLPSPAAEKTAEENTTAPDTEHTDEATMPITVPSSNGESNTRTVNPKVER